MSQDYERLGVLEFGAHLLDSNDLDPVYVALHRARLEPGVLRRWLVAYWYYYDCGVASFASERTGADFRDVMLTAARNQEPAPTGGRWTRGKERRHMRGRSAEKAMRLLYETYGDEPERMVDDIVATPEPRTCHRVMLAARKNYGCGPWLAFKVADMVDRVMGVPVCFEQATLLLYDSPRRAAVLMAESLGADIPAVEKTQWACKTLTEHFRDRKAPPFGDRPIALNEVETILCKWGSHLSGHYPLFNDQDEINHGIQVWLPHSSVARRFSEAMPGRERIAK